MFPHHILFSKPFYKLPIKGRQTKRQKGRDEQKKKTFLKPPAPPLAKFSLTFSAFHAAIRQLQMVQRTLTLTRPAFQNL